MSGRLQRIDAPASWRRVDLISDLHLHDGDRATFEAWCGYLRHHQADALFILGDLFEAWVGDDAIRAAPGDDPSGFAARAADALRGAALRSPVYFMAGNRDFLVGPALASACGFALLDDPCVLSGSAGNWLLSHGDALCVDDHAYQAFRAQVRSTDWQQAFLARPLAERLAIAREMRQRSMALQAARSGWIDVDAQAARSALQAANARTLLHGHTHRPGAHDLGEGLMRIVLSDWDLQATPPRAQVLRIDPHASTIPPQRLAPAQA